VKLQIEWSRQALSDLQRLDRPIAIRILETLTRFAETGQGDVKRPKEKEGSFRLRIGDYRVRFLRGKEAILIQRVLHRGKAYR